MSRFRVAMLLAACFSLTTVSAADLHKLLIGKWVVDERTRLEASPLYQLATPAKKQELEKDALSMPAIVLEFKDTSYTMMGEAPIAYKVIKRGANDLVLETTEKAGGNEMKDELTIEYINDTSLRLTAKSQGIPLVIKRSR